MYPIIYKVYIWIVYIYIYPYYIHIVIQTLRKVKDLDSFSCVSILIWKLEVNCKPVNYI